MNSFEPLTLKCHCCEIERKDTFIKIYRHDVSFFVDSTSGTLVLNCRYCCDNEICKKKASDRAWIKDRFLGTRVDEEKIT